MKTITKQYKIYNFDELAEEGKDNALTEYFVSLLECVAYEHMTTNEKRAVDKAEQMQTPWFTISYLYDYCKQDAIETIQSNEYQFLENGTIFN